MKVLLRRNVSKLGKIGEQVEVRDGYARNYLLPQRLAVAASDANKKIVEQERHAHLRREAKVKVDAEDLGKLMTGVSVTIAHKAGELEQLFGSVTSKDIAEALEKQNFTIDRKKIHLDEPIRQLGEFRVPLRLHRDVTVEILVHVVREQE
jgi:large subunit ribosomal protein L9